VQNAIVIPIITAVTISFRPLPRDSAIAVERGKKKMNARGPWLYVLTDQIFCLRNTHGFVDLTLH